METLNIHIELINKKKKLQNIASQLKQQFLGLDSVIDEVMNLLLPWYLFPEAQLRPTVINLWGLTGSGKTALVKAIVEHLDYRKLYSHIDMGEFESDSASWIKNIFTDDLSFFHEKSSFICLDEFQFARTLDSNKNELGKDKLRVIWDLLDSGRIEYIPGQSTYYLFRADNCLKRLDKIIRSGVVMEKGKIVQEIEAFNKIFEGYYFDQVERYNKSIDQDYFLSEDFVEGMFNLFDDETSKESIKRKIEQCTLQELCLYILDGMHSRPATRTLDLSRAVIFVLGNLDEAYTMSRNMNPDISADDFHEQTSKITLANIKSALCKRFRPEQIARLGNNHIIYKSFNSSQFRALIMQELNRVGTFVNEKFDWQILFDNSIIEIVYNEGVFPAQGTRPVLTTVKNLIESKITALAVKVLETRLEVSTIVWSYKDERFVYVIQNAEGKEIAVLQDEVTLKLGNLRKSIDPHIQAHVAVHESGHAVLAALTFRMLPSVVVSRTASDAEGFCMVTFPKGPMTRESLKKDIIVTLGGYVAERMIFGETFTCSGVSFDIEEASALANKAIRKYAMGSDPIHLAVTNSQSEDAFVLSRKYADEALAIVRECEKEAEVILKRNKLLLLKMAEYLTTNSRMEETLIGEFVKKYGKEAWLKTNDFVNRDDYYRFNAVLGEQLAMVEQEEEETATILEFMAEIDQSQATI